MKKAWFREWKWVWVPASWQGAVVTGLILVFCAQVFVAVDRQSHSASDTLYGVFPYWVPAIGILLWVASKSSSGK